MNVAVKRCGELAQDVSYKTPPSPNIVDPESVDDHFTYGGYSVPAPSYHSCFGLPYQDHNYVAPPPPTPPPSPPPPPKEQIVPHVVDKELVNGHIEVEDVSVGPPAAFTDVVAKELSVDDDSITRCICDYKHDDGYMICCDKCSVWQHIDCMQVDRANIPELYFCEICDPRPVNREFARDLQTKRKELLIDTDSSATDTDPEEAMNRQMSEQQQQQQLQHGQQDKIKKTKKKRLVKIKGEPKNGATHGKIDKVSRKQKDKRELKKEKENKETDRKPKFSLKEAISKKINSKGKFKKSGLSLITNENSRNPYDSSNSPWVDKYEEAKVNQYTTEIETLLILRINGQHASLAPPLTEKLQAQLCNVTEVGKNRKGLEATETIGEGEPIIEYKGQVMLKQQFEKEHSFSKQFNPFVLFYNKFENVEMCINATSYGNNARFIRRSCKANAEVKHVIQNGEMAFYIFSSKVIPRGSELTIPYDYSYKECSYCVECACLRNNCPVAKFFKRKNLQKKEKIVKPPKSPSKTPGKICRSPTKSPVKSPIATLAESPLKSDTSSQPSATSSRKSSEEGSEIHKSVKERKNQSQETVKALETSTDSNSANIDSHSETEENAVEKIHKKTREERKMEAIMKAFEKLEKRQERRKEALARMDSRTHKENEEDNHTIEEKKCETTPTQVREEDTVAVESEVEKEKTEPLTPMKELVVPEETVKEVEEPAKTDVTQFKREVRPRTAKRSRRATISGRRKSRMNSNNSSERSASVEEVATVQSCPATPIVSSSSSGLSGPDTLNTPPSFKFLKTKKHLMSEWLSEKVSEQPSKSSVDKDQNEPVEITVTAFVTCLPSPRNSMEHLRRNSQSTGGSRLADRGTDNSAGSAKKRWLRQAMGDNPGPESSAAGAPLSSCASPGALSPNPALGMPSPCASPPGDFVTPLKKRRLARESLDNPLPVANNNPASTTAMTIGSDLAVQEDGEVCNTGSHVSPDTQSSDWSEIKGFKKKFAARRMREFSGESQRDSTESEAACSSLNNTVCRNSFDLSDLEQETISTSEATCAQNISTSRPGLCDSNTDEKMSQERLHSVGSSSVKKGFLNRSTLVCQSSVESETDQPMDTSECDSNTRGTAIGDMEVDSSVDSSRPSSVADPTICDSTSRGDESRPRVQDQLEIASTSQQEEETEGFEGSRESRTLVSVVDSSTDFEQVDSAMCNSGLAQADQSTESDSSVWRTRTNSYDSCEAASSKDGRASVESFEENSDLSSSVSRIRHLSSSASSLRSENVGSSSDKKRGNSLFDVSSSSETSKRDLVESSLTGDSGRNVSSTEQGGPYEPVVSGTHNSVVSGSGVEQSPKNSVSASNVGSSPSLVSASFNSNSSPGNNSVSASNLSLPDDAADSSIGPTLCRLDLDESSASGSIGEAEGVSNSVGVCSHLEQEQRHMDYGLDIGIRHQDEIASSSSSNVSSMSPMLLDESSNYASSSVLTSLSQTNSMEEPPPPPPPAKKKVSLLEYRKRLKGKSSSNGSSATSSLSPSIPPPLPPPAPSPSSSLSSSFVSSPVASTSGTPTSASPAMTSAKSTSLLSSPKSLSLFETPGLPAAPPPPPPKRSSVSSRHLPTLPSLPLFETSPGKEPPRHHFRSSSDLIKKKAPEPKKREKPLSLTERLKMEFGIADNDEDNKKDQSLALRKRGQDAYDSARNASSSSSSRQGATTPPPPPPPPPSRSQTTDVLCRGSGVGGQGSKAGHEAESTLVPPPPPVPPAQQTPMYSGVPLPVPPPAHNPLGIRATSPAGMVLPIPGPPGKIGPMNGLTPTASSVQPNGPGLVPNAGLMPPRIPNLGQPRMVQNGQGRPPGKQIPSLLTIQPFAPLKNQNGMLMSSGPRVASPKPVPPVAGHGLIPPDKADAGLVYSHPAGVPDQAIALSDQPSGAPQANIPLKTNHGGAFDQVGFTQPGFSQQPNGGNYGANSEGNNMSVDYHHGFRSGSVEEYEADFSAKTEDYSSQDFHQDYSSNASDGYGGYNHDYSSSNDNDYKHNYGSSKGGGGRDHRLFSHSPSSNYHSSASRYHPKPGKGYSHSKHRRKGYSDSY